LGKKLGQGSFGKCYQATDIKDGNKEVAVKLEPAKAKNPQLLVEAKLFQQLAGGIGVPEVFWSGTDMEYNVMAIELLGSSVEDIFRSVGRRFSMKTVLMLGDQMLNRLEWCHSRSLIHRDVKPDNFVMGLGDKSSIVYIIDFGLAKRYRNQKTLVHNVYSERSPLTGTARYASINTHMSVEQSRRDDLESLAYTLLYLARGGLHWQGLKAPSKKEKYQKILEKKMGLSMQALVGPAPKELGTFLLYSRSLRFEETPDYDYLRKLLRGGLRRMKVAYDLTFSWMPGGQPAPRKPPAPRQQSPAPLALAGATSPRASGSPQPSHASAMLSPRTEGSSSRYAELGDKMASRSSVG